MLIFIHFLYDYKRLLFCLKKILSLILFSSLWNFSPRIPFFPLLKKSSNFFRGHDFWIFLKYFIQKTLRIKPFACIFQELKVSIMMKIRKKIILKVLKVLPKKISLQESIWSQSVWLVTVLVIYKIKNYVSEFIWWQLYWYNCLFYKQNFL